MQEPIVISGIESAGPMFCDTCGKVFAQTDSLRRASFCSFHCEHLWAEENGECVIRKRGHFPRIGYVDGEVFTFPQSPGTLIEHARTFPIDLLTFLQHPAQTGIVYCYPAEIDNLAVVPISNYEHWWTHQVDSKTRNMVRKCERAGVEVREVALTDEFVQAIWRMYNDAPVRRGKHFKHFGMTLDKVRETTNTFPSRNIFLAAFWKEQIIGFLRMATDQNRNYADILSILSLVEHKDKAVMNGLIAGAVRSCVGRSINQLAYEHMYYYGKRDGLSSFKANNGFVAQDVVRYFVPTTTRGSVALRLGLHRNWRCYVPSWAIERYCSVRSSWHQRLRSDTKSQG